MSDDFTRDSHHKCAFMGGPTTTSKKSKMANGGHIEFRKMPISPYWMKAVAQNLIQLCNAIPWRCPRDQKQKRKLICMTSLSNLGTNVGRSQES